MKLGEICEISMGQSPKSIYYNSEEKGLPFLQGNRTFGSKTPIFDTYTTLATKIAEAGDVIMSVRAPVGDVNITPVKMCLGRGVCSLRHYEDEQEFLYYLMRYYVKDLINRESGTVFGSVNRNDIANLEIEIPPRTELHKIGRILGTLDDKIELNRKINHHLEALAQAVFLELCTEGKTAVLSDILTVCYGKDHKQLGTGKIPCYGSGGIMRYVDKTLYAQESVLIPRKGTLNNVLYVNEPFWTVDTMFYTHMLRPNVAKFVYFIVRNLDLAGMNVGSAVPSMTTTILNALEIVLPCDDVLSIFEGIVAPMFLQIQTNNIESAKLAALRDALLPRLMSGELSVADIDVK